MGGNGNPGRRSKITSQPVSNPKRSRYLSSWVKPLVEVVTNPHLDLVLTRHSGHISYYSSLTGQRRSQDPDPWWDWNRVLDWVERRSPGHLVDS